MNNSLGVVVAIAALFYWVVMASLELEAPSTFAEWYRKPGNSIQFYTWLLSIAGVAITQFSSCSTLNSFRKEAIAIAITVIVLEGLGRHRSNLEEKERIIRQMGSHSNDFALEAVRLIVGNGWHTDGSLRNRELPGANLEGAQLHNAQLQGTNLFRAILVGAELINANLAGAKLFKADLQETKLYKANLQGANLLQANLHSADLWDAKLHNADLWQSNLQQARLFNASLQEASLTNANLNGADLKFANLQGADLRGASFQLATYTKETIWPAPFDPKCEGAVLMLWDVENRKWYQAENVVTALTSLDG